MLTYRLWRNELERHKRTINAQEILKLGLGKLIYKESSDEELTHLSVF
jgi:hypothetical protein